MGSVVALPRSGVKVLRQLNQTFKCQRNPTGDDPTQYVCGWARAPKVLELVPVSQE